MRCQSRRHSCGCPRDEMTAPSLKNFAEAIDAYGASGEVRECLDALIVVVERKLSKRISATGEGLWAREDEPHRQRQLFDEFVDPLFSSTVLNRISRTTNQLGTVLIVEG